MKAKTIHIISSLKRGGRERQLSTIISKAVLDGYSTKIVYFNSTNSSYIDEYNLKPHILKIQSKIFLIRLLELDKLLRCHKPDVVYTWGNLESFFVLLLKHFHNFQFINGSVRHGIRLKKFSHYFRTAILHLSEHIVANSFAGLKANKLNRGFVLYNGVDEKFLTPIENRFAKRAKLIGTPDNTLIFVSAANLVPYKDYYTVIEVLEKIKKEGIDFHYLVLGNGRLRKKLEEFVKKLGLETYVTFAGNVENIHEYLKISDIFIHSSKGEGCSNAILEAMSAGLPIVAADTGGTPEIVSDQFGRLFEYQDSSQLYSNLKEILSEKRKLREIGINAKKEIEEKYTVKKMMSNFYNIIQCVLKNKGSTN